MRIPLTALLISTLIVAGCGNSRLNPFNWFGRGQSEPVATAENANPLIPKRSNGLLYRPKAPYPGVLIAKVTDLKIERIPGGAIVRATGIGHFQGSYEVRLVPADQNQATDKTLTYEFRANLPPSRGRVQGSEWSRTITAAANLTDNQLAEIRTIRVVAAENAMSSRR